MKLSLKLEYSRFIDRLIGNRSRFVQAVSVLVTCVIKPKWLFAIASCNLQSGRNDNVTIAINLLQLNFRQKKWMKALHEMMNVVSAVFFLSADE